MVLPADRHALHRGRFFVSNGEKSDCPVGRNLCGVGRIVVLFLLFCLTARKRRVISCGVDHRCIHWVLIHHLFSTRPATAIFRKARVTMRAVSAHFDVEFGNLIVGV